MPNYKIRRCSALAAALLFHTPTASADAVRLTIEHIDLKPTKDGLYDATVGFVLSDAKLGKDKKVGFSIVVGNVHDADEAMTKVHEPVKTMSEDLQQGYKDIHREP